MTDSIKQLVLPEFRLIANVYVVMLVMQKPINHRGKPDGERILKKDEYVDPPGPSRI